MKYRTIVIDPPWTLSTINPRHSRHGGSPFLNNSIPKNLPYKTMTDKEITEFPINNFAEYECDLFLWTTNGKLLTALKVLEAWQFKYSSLLVWNKRDGLSSQGIHYTLEFLLYAYRKRKGLDYTHPIESYYQAKRLRHSQKPNIVYAVLAKATQEPRIDIFARKRHYGFDAWGDQVEKQIEYPLELLSHASH